MPRMVVCPDCRAEISKQAKTCPRCGRPNKSKGNYGCGSLILGSIVVFFVVTPIMRKRGEGPIPDPDSDPAAVAPPPAAAPGLPAAQGDPAVTQATRPRAGAAGVIARPGLDGTWAAIDEAAFDLMTRAFLAKNTDLLMSMIREGKVVQVPNGTRVHVLESPFTSSKFRVADGPQKGFEGWTPWEYIAAQ
jgi:hypothetical protein